LKEDLLAYRGRYRELEELNIQIEKENERLVDANAERRETVLGLRDQILEVGCQPSCANEDRETTAKNMTQADVEDKSGPFDCSDSMSLKHVQLPEHLPSLTRKHGELEEEFDSGQEQRKVRRRKYALTAIIWRSWREFRGRKLEILYLARGSSNIVIICIL